MNSATPETLAEAHFHRCMALWVDWMGHDRAPGKPRTRDSVCGQALTNYMTSHDDSDIVYEASDRKVGAAVQACVESLFNFEQAAVMIKYGLSRQWPFPQYVEADCLRTGMKRLREKVAQRC